MVSRAIPWPGHTVVMRVLLVEDFEPLARSLAQGLREAGYAVDAAGDGEEALALGEANPYDAILLDLMIPKVDGAACSPDCAVPAPPRRS